MRIENYMHAKADTRCNLISWPISENVVNIMYDLQNMNMFLYLLERTKGITYQCILVSLHLWGR